MNAHLAELEWADSPPRKRTTLQFDIPAVNCSDSKHAGGADLRGAINLCNPGCSQITAAPFSGTRSSSRTLPREAGQPLLDKGLVLLQSLQVLVGEL